MTRQTHVERRLEFGVDIPCRKCKTKGEITQDGKRKTCPKCEGRGFITNQVADKEEV